MKRELLLALSIGMITVCVVILGMTGPVATAYGAPGRVSPSEPGAGLASPALQTNGLAPGVLGAAAGTDVKNLNTGATYATIADALADAATLDGHVIEVQVSPHAEGIVNVTKSVTIRGMMGTEVVNAAASTGSSGDARGWFVINADNVTIQGLTLDGSGYQIYQTIRCNNAGLVVDNCTIQHIQYQQYLGFGVTSVGNATITDCTMSDIERLGVLLFGPGVTSGSVDNLTYTGKGLGDWLDYAVEFGAGAVGSVTNCTVTGCAGTALSDGSTSAGFIATDYYGPGTAATYSGNAVGSSTAGIAAGYSATDASVVSASDNDFSGNDYGIGNASTVVVVDGSANWWGSNDAATVSAYMDGDVDYTPWLDSGADTDGAPGFQGDFSVLHVDAASPQTGSTGRINEGIGLVSGSTVYVAPGLYAERVTVNKTVDLRGAQYGVDPTLAGARTNPATESIVDISGLGVTNPNVTLEIPSGVTGASVSGFTLVGSPTIHYADESVIRCWDDNLTVQDNIIDGYSGIIYKGNDYFTARRNRMTVNKGGITVQPNPATFMMIEGNTFVLGGSPAGDESAIYLTGTADCDVVGNTASGFTGRGVGGSNHTRLLVEGNTFTGCRDAVSFWGTTTFVDILDNVIDGSTRYGITVKGQDINILDNEITNSVDSGVNIDRHVIDTERVAINRNTITGNAIYGIRVNTASVTDPVDATCNWWGTPDGPNDPPGNPSTGDDLLGVSEYAPWLDSAGGVCDQYGDYVAADPTGLCISGPTPCVTSAVEFVRDDTTPARGVTVTVELSADLELCGAGIVQGDWLDGYGLGSTFQVTDLGGGIYIVDQAVLGGDTDCGPTTGGTLFTMDVTNTGGDGTGTITVTAVDARDCGNPFAYLPGIPGPPAEIQIDNTEPGAVADLAASQVKSGNDSDGTTKIDLSWTAPPETDVATVDLYRKGFGYYPEYDDDGGSAPGAPADQATAAGAGWTHVVSLAGAASGYTDEPGTRDYWYYVAYVVDDCGNVSAVSNRTGGTLNYHLGDVAPGLGDNQVTGLDVSDLGDAYGTSHGDALYDNELDVGPTADNSTNGLPTTDNLIQFEDLIIFAINYGTVTKPGLTPQAADRNAIRVDAPRAVEAGTIIEVPVTLSSDGAIQGVSVPLTWNASVVEPVEMIPGEYLERQPAPAMAFTARAGAVDAAVFGATFSGEGELARIAFRTLAAGDPGIALGEVEARDSENREVKLELTTGVGDGRTLPVVTRLLPCAPNPFRSASVISFALAEEGPVTLRVYAVDGRLVRTLVQSVLPAGEQSVQWDGRDDSGRSVAAGAYLLRLQAAQTAQSQRIVRLQ